MSKKVALKCNFISDNGVKCFRKALEGNEKCNKHVPSEKEIPKAEINKECPICLEETDEGMYLISCHHRCHLECMKGLTKIECPMCRQEIINLPKELKDKILANGRQYAREQEDTNRTQLMEMLQSEMQDSVFSRIPPQMEVLLAMRYLNQLGIPPSRIPREARIELDPESPLPSPGSIFQVSVAQMVDAIQRQASVHPVEDDSSDDEYDHSEEDGDPSDEENPFRMEGGNLGLRHTVRTVPSPNHRSMRLASQIPMFFNTMSAVLGDLGAISFPFGDGSFSMGMGPDDEDEIESPD